MFVCSPQELLCCTYLVGRKPTGKGRGRGRDVVAKPFKQTKLYLIQEGRGYRKQAPAQVRATSLHVRDSDVCLCAWQGQEVPARRQARMVRIKNKKHSGNCDEEFP